MPFVKGQTGNISGRPKGSSAGKQLAAIISKKLLQTPYNDKRNFGQIIVDTLFEIATGENKSLSFQAIREIMNRTIPDFTEENYDYISNIVNETLVELGLVEIEKSYEPQS